MEAPSTTAHVLAVVDPCCPALPSPERWREYARTLDEAKLGLGPGANPKRYGVRPLTFSERGAAKACADSWEWACSVVSAGLVYRQVDGRVEDLKRTLVGGTHRLSAEALEAAVGGSEDVVFQLGFLIGLLTWPETLSKKSEWQSGSPTKPIAPSTAGPAATTTE